MLLEAAADGPIAIAALCGIVFTVIVTKVLQLW